MQPIHSKVLFLLNYREKLGRLPQRINHTTTQIDDIPNAKKELAKLIDGIMFTNISDEYMEYIGNEIRLLDYVCEQDLKNNSNYHYDWVDHYNSRDFANKLV